MNAREALNEIENLFDDVATWLHQNASDFDYEYGLPEKFGAISTALTELERLQERDTAKKIIFESGRSGGTCPSCNSHSWVIRNFCPQCGQRLSWEE